MAKISGIHESIDARLKKAVRKHGLSIDKAAGRVLGDAVLSVWHYGMGPAPIVLKGGSLFPQSMRETDDVDILTIRRYTNREIHNGFKIIAPLLEARGITLEFLSEEAQVLDVGYGDPVTRYKLRGKVGGVRANTHVDMTLARGPHALPPVVLASVLPSFVESVDPLRIKTVPLDTVAAEKWLAVLTQSPTDYRVKHLADLFLLDNVANLDHACIAEEIERVARHRGMTLACCTPTPDALRWPSLALREHSWNKLPDARRYGRTLFQAFVDINALWSNVHAQLCTKVGRDYRQPGYDPMHLDRLLAGRGYEPRLKPAGAA
ncbi:nucleotidyl transferase AbiEii/AbiGii toxin family protein [Agrobacterium salinitolerans]|uniref:nucleotidyl transferase AbiEii/AbiGii toxin family protein n=1 Tax=Agrobacterium salinitolerans TaxID=1183413 RepID=UPI0022B8197F|nr:nucleotidyl transferase AbiEii/AbiGii toxin family protein [Agrobacterium salinitolerans]MCZ7885379.1 nucleotidyl transferase AbiEii/AbiGii toxin family protein [Agrobacterium salinitolerans]